MNEWLIGIGSYLLLSGVTNIVVSITFARWKWSPEPRFSHALMLSIFWPVTWFVIWRWALRQLLKGGL